MEIYGRRKKLLLRKEWFEDVEGERERLDGCCARPNYHAPGKERLKHQVLRMMGVIFKLHPLTRSIGGQKPKMAQK